MDLTNVEFLSSSEEINKRPDEYWTLVMDSARKNNLKRVLRCGLPHSHFQRDKHKSRAQTDKLEGVLV